MAIILVGRAILAAGTVTVYVDAGSACTTGCGSQTAPHKTLAAGESDANAQISAGTATSAIVRVAAGTYLERLFIHPNIHVVCASPVTTTIDATGKGRAAVILAQGTSGRPRIDFSIEGCRITGGIGEIQSQYRNAGGGVFVYGDAVVSGNLITGNTVTGAGSEWVGGGVYVAYGNARIIGNTISRNVVNPPPLGGNNDSRGSGAGVFINGPNDLITGQQVVVEGNIISENFAGGEIGRGGAIRIGGNPGSVVFRNTIVGNRALTYGAGVTAYSTIEIRDNVIYGNSAGMFGAGLDIYHATAQVTNNTIVGNSLTDTRAPSGYTFANYGGGVRVGALTLQPPDRVQVTNNLIVGNTVSPAGTGAGLFSELTSPIISSTDFHANLKLPSTTDHVAGDLTPAQVIGLRGNVSVDPRFTTAPAFTDTTIAAGTTTTLAVTTAARHAVNQVIEYNNDGVARTVTALNATANTLTFTPALPAASQAFKLIANWGVSTNTTEDFRLRADSPVIDAGTNTGVSTVDLAGNIRVADGNTPPDGIAIVDLGAYEVVPADPDPDGDGVPNSLDCADLVSSVQIPPGTVASTLRLRQGTPTPLGWDKIAQANTFNVYRGGIVGTFGFNQVCKEAASPDRAWGDIETPPVGTAYFYLISAVNSCGEGGLGQTSTGAERPNPSPCIVAPVQSDADGIADMDDNCPLVANADQADAPDTDGVGTVCDNCPTVANPTQADGDQNNVGDACQDSDADGFIADVDCNDLNPSVHPGAIEVCNNLDDDCDGAVDEDLGTLSCGQGVCAHTVTACLNGTPQTCTPGTPGTETCNNLDDDCDSAVDEDLGTLSCGQGACALTVNACLDGTPQTCTPGTPDTETCNNIDDDCDGSVDEGFDLDGDGFKTCAGDCNDNAPAIHPGAPEACNGVDDDCDVLADEGYLDFDGDLLADCVDPDDDNDLVADASDCAPYVNSVSAIPGEVGFSVMVNPAQPPGAYLFSPVAQANVHNVYRWTWDGRTGTWSDIQSCLVPETTSRGFADAATPPIGSIFFYDLTGTNRCGEGPAGQSTTGIRRPIATYCAPLGRDGDSDLVPDLDDNCPVLANASQADRDHDGRGDGCDVCLDVYDPGQEDSDGNGVGNACQ